MGWINDTDVLVRLLDQAKGDAIRLGHQTTGWAATDQEGVYSATCSSCWATGTVTVRRLGTASVCGALVALDCRPEAEPETIELPEVPHLPTRRRAA